MKWIRYGLVAIGTLLCTQVARAEKRVALVIGNGAYLHADRLANSVLDARRTRDALAKLGFSVIYGEDLDQRDIRRTNGKFADAADGADVALVYFAGHGATFSDTPYIVPIDAEFQSLGDMPYELISVEMLIGELRRAKGVRIAILNACRDDAAERNLKKVATRGLGVSLGLARVKDPDGLIIAYGTQYMTTAADGDPKSDSPFTAALLKYIATPNLDVKDMFFKVATEVIRTTKGQQRPEISISMYDDYLLAGTAGSTSQAAVAVPVGKEIRTEPAARASHDVAALHPQGEGKIEARVPSDELDVSTLTSSPTIYRAALLVEDASAPDKMRTYLGRAAWNWQTRNGLRHVEAAIDLPDDKMNIVVTFEKNDDASIAASHIVKVRFAMKPDCPTGGIDKIALPQPREEASSNGTAVAGVIVPVISNSYLIGLTSGAAEASNVRLLSTLPWIDIPILFANGKLAKVTFEKGAAGSEYLSALLNGREPKAQANAKP